MVSFNMAICKSWNWELGNERIVGNAGLNAGNMGGNGGNMGGNAEKMGGSRRELK